MAEYKDFVGDNNPALISFVKSAGVLPEYVEDSPIITKEEVDALASTAFADPVSRQFPIHTKTACLLSAAYAAGYGSSAATMNNITKMAHAHGISEDVDKVLEVFDSCQKQAAAHEEEQRKYAMAIDFDGIQGRGVEYFYPINNEDEILSSAESAVQDYINNNMPLPGLRKAAKLIMEEAGKYDIEDNELPKDIVKIGSASLPNMDRSYIIIDSREAHGKDINPYNAILKKAAAEIYATDDFNKAIEIAEEAAEEIYDLDMRNGLFKYSNAKLPDPYSTIFNGVTINDLQKVASWFMSVNNVDVPAVDFLNISPARIEEMFNKEAAASLVEAQNLISGDQPPMESYIKARSIVGKLSADQGNTLLQLALESAW